MQHDTNIEMMARQARMRDAELRPAAGAKVERAIARTAANIVKCPGLTKMR